MDYLGGWPFDQASNRQSRRPSRTGRNRIGQRLGLPTVTASCRRHPLPGGLGESQPQPRVTPASVNHESMKIPGSKSWRESLSRLSLVQHFQALRVEMIIASRLVCGRHRAPLLLLSLSSTKLSNQDTRVLRQGARWVLVASERRNPGGSGTIRRA